MVVMIKLEREADGRWLAEIPSLAGVLTYGASCDEAVARIQALALRVFAERLEHGEAAPELLDLRFQLAATENLVVFRDELRKGVQALRGIRLTRTD